MDFAYPAEADAYRSKVRAFLDANLPKDWKGVGALNHEDAVKFAEDWRVKLRDNGMLAVTWPKEYGGAGLSHIEALVIAEEFAKAGVPGGVANDGFGIGMLGNTLLAVGTEEQKKHYLPRILSGEDRWCQGYSEPAAGSDLGNLGCRAELDGDEWVINGQKIWTSFGAVADYCYLICRTSTDGPPHAGISEIVVPMNTPGIEAREIQDMTTNRHFCEVFFTDARVPKDNLVGLQGGAFKQTMRQLEHERGGIDRLVSNYALYAMALERADLTDPRVRQEVARLETGYRIGRILVIREVLRQAPAGFSAATKCFCTEHEQRVAHFVAKTFGLEATLWDDVTAGLMYGPGYTIMGGTSNVMRNILGERVLGLPKEPGK